MILHPRLLNATKGGEISLTVALETGFVSRASGGWRRRSLESPVQKTLPTFPVLSPDLRTSGCSGGCCNPPAHPEIAIRSRNRGAQGRRVPDFLPL